MEGLGSPETTPNLDVKSRGPSHTTIIVDKLIKWGYFIVYIEEISIEDIARIYVKEVFIRYGVLIKIILDRDLRFIVVF